MRWLMLLMSLPPTPTRHRVGVWRKLQRMGAVRLRGSAWILPETPETTELFQWLVQERSEEHTSELQSLAYLVCRLLLEKKKKIKTTRTAPITKTTNTGTS